MSAHTTPPAEQLDAKALASSRREAMRRRAHRIRRSVVGLSLGLFVAAFLAVYVQLASGHDPALSSAAKRRSSVTTSVATSKEVSTTASGKVTNEGSSESSPGSETSSGSESTSGSETSSGEEPSTSASAVTTSQS